MSVFLTPTFITSFTSGIKTVWNHFDGSRNIDANKLSVSTIILLDPLTTILRLGILKYKQDSTKIGVANNKLTFYEPTVYQGIYRWWSGDSRTDIQYLYLPLLYFSCIHHNYVKSIFDECENKEEILNRINSMAIDGLKTLRNIYSQHHHKIDMVTNCIDSYIHLLSVTDDDSGFIKSKYEDVQNTIKLTYKEFSKEWTTSYIKIILDLINELHNKDSTEYRASIVSNIEGMLNTMDGLIDRARS